MEKSSQHITIILDENSDPEISIRNGFHLAHVFSKSVQIIVLKSYQSGFYDDLEDEIRSIADVININNPARLNIHFVERFREIPSEMGCLINDTYFFMITLGKPWGWISANRYYFLKTIKKFRAPVLIFNRKFQETADLTNGLLPLDHKKESREKILWTCAFGKHARSKINIVVPAEKDEGLRQTMNNSLFLCKRTMKQLEINFEVKRFPGSIFRSNEIALQNNWNEQPGFCVIAISRYMNYVNYLFGYSETEQLFNDKGIPILLINPREDLYVPCI